MEGTDMDKVIEYSNLLINNPNFSLESNYFHNFDINNDTSKEMIFTVVQKKIANSDKGSDNDLAYMSMERIQSRRLITGEQMPIVLLLNFIIHGPEILMIPVSKEHINMKTEHGSEMTEQILVYPQQVKWKEQEALVPFQQRTAGWSAIWS